LAVFSAAEAKFQAPVKAPNDKAETPPNKRRRFLLTVLKDSSKAKV
jgi:hypothetical protein